MGGLPVAGYSGGWGRLLAVSASLFACHWDEAFTDPGAPGEDVTAPECEGPECDPDPEAPGGGPEVMASHCDPECELPGISGGGSHCSKWGLKRDSDGVCRCREGWS